MVFALFVALPSVALAVAGVRAISADDVARADASRRRAEFIAMNADDSIVATLPQVSHSDPAEPGASDRIQFRRDANGTMSFPQHRVFVADFGVIPAALSNGDGLSGAGAVPDAIVAALSSRSGATYRQALDQLRAGTWWLHLDQRRAYDGELIARLVAAGVTDVERIDRRLEQLVQIQSIVTAAIAAGMRPGRASSAPTSAGTFLIIWSPDTRQDGSSAGVVIDPAETAVLMRGALADAMNSQLVAADIRDERGSEVWRLSERPVSSDAVVKPLSAVDDWVLRVSPLEWRSGRSLWVYGLVVLPIALLAFGLVLTSRVVRREVALARRQAEFTAAVTHEFKSPITSLRLLMERIASGRVAGGPALTEYHDAITREINRLDSLVNRLLDTQQIQAGKRGHTPVLTAVAPIVAGAVDRFRAQAAEKQIDLRVNQPDSALEMPLDRDSVSDALDNLIDNAIKYSPSGSAVTVTTADAHGHVAIEVRDQGAGIHRDDLPHVFEPYFRGRLGDRESVRGTGLGLALVQAAAMAHGGTVDVISSPGKGSTFTLRLPVGKSA